MSALRVLQVNTFERAGGASRAAHRLHLALREQGVASEMLVMHRETDAPHVAQPLGPAMRQARRLLEAAASYTLRLQRTGDATVLRSLNLFPSGLAGWINRSDFDVVNLHWLGGEMLSVEEIGRIRKPVCWTLHDLWPLAGAEHYDALAQPGRFHHPYTRAGRPAAQRGPDLDAWVWRRKARAWRGLQLELVAPSRWMARCAADSALMATVPCTVIPNGLDTEVFRPRERQAARQALGLAPDRRYILFGASTGQHDPRKGFHLLLPALATLAQQPAFARDTQLLVFGASGAALPPLPLPAHALGFVGDEARLACIYAAADVFAAPSLQDNLPNTVAEALACGTPTVAFATGGLPDLVTHRASGWLAQPFSVEDLAQGLAYVLATPGLGARCRADALAGLDQRVVAPRYLQVYERLAAAAAGAGARLSSAG